MSQLDLKARNLTRLLGRAVHIGINRIILKRPTNTRRADKFASE